MKQIYSLILIMIILFAGCDNQTDPLSNKEDYDTPLTINSVAMLDAGGTRSTTTLMAGNLGLYRFSDNGYPEKMGIIYYYQSGWKSVTPVYLGNLTASFLAFYPYDASNLSLLPSSPIQVRLTSQKYTEGEDMCYSGKVSTPNKLNPNVDFTMTHAYAKLTINIKNKMTTRCDLSLISIANSRLIKSSYLNMVTGVYDPAPVFGTVNRSLALSIQPGATYSTALLMIPTITPMVGNVVFTFTTNNIDKVAYVDAASSGLSTLQPGGNYTLNVNVVE